MDRPNVIFPAISSTLALIALSPTPSFIPLIFLVATLLVYTRFSIRRPHAPRAILGTLLGVSIASTLSHILPSIHALSSTSLSIISLWILSSLSSTVAFSIVLLDRFSLCLNIPWAKIAFFPAIWASSWQLISHASPVGHLVTWSPVTGIASYEWVRPLFGAWGVNWVVGAYAIVMAELVGAWFIGPVEDFEPPGPLIPSVVSDADPQPLTSKPAFPKTTYHSLLLGTALLGLTLPSFFLPTVPTFPWSVSSTPLPIGCVLPHPSQPDDGITPLDRFIVESRQHNGARLLLWPEGALRFENTAQRESAINRVKDEIKGPIVGVTFTEPVPPSAGWTHSRDGAWRNGLVLVGPNGLIAEFYKRNLVPSTCSSIIESSSHSPSPVQSLNLSLSPNPRRNLSCTRLSSMEVKVTRSGPLPLHTTGPSPLLLLFASISPVHPSLPH
jgi:hypothetical protein